MKPPLSELAELLRSWLDRGHPRWRRRYAALAGLAGLLLFAAWGIFGTPQGLWALYRSQRQKTHLRAEIAELQRGNEELRRQLAEVQRTHEGVEDAARERLQLMRPGEIIYRFQ